MSDYVHGYQLTGATYQNYSGERLCCRIFGDIHGVSWDPPNSGWDAKGLRCIWGPELIPLNALKRIK